MHEKRREKRKRKGKKNKAGINKAYQDAQDPCSSYHLGDALKTMFTTMFFSTNQVILSAFSMKMFQENTLNFGYLINKMLHGED
jgi:hypothetical protein